MSASSRKSKQSCGNGIANEGIGVAACNENHYVRRRRSALRLRRHKTNHASISGHKNLTCRSSLAEKPNSKVLLPATAPRQASLRPKRDLQPANFRSSSEGQAGIHACLPSSPGENRVVGRDRKSFLNYPLPDSRFLYWAEKELELEM